MAIIHDLPLMVFDQGSAYTGVIQHHDKTGAIFGLIKKTAWDKGYG